MPSSPIHAAVVAVALSVAPRAAAATEPPCVEAFRTTHEGGPYRASARVAPLRGEPSIVEAAERMRSDERLDLLVLVDPARAGQPLRMHLASATMPQRRSRALVHDALESDGGDDARICALVDAAERVVVRADATRRAFAATAIGAFGLFGVLWWRARR